MRGNKGFLTNHEIGEISIVCTGRFGLNNVEGKTYINFGTLNIDSTSNDGIFNLGLIDNKATGSININEAGDFGIFVGTGDDFRNSGTINILNSADDGIFNKGLFVNRANGIIDIEGADGFGFYNTTNKILNNQGELHIRNSTANALHNNGTVTNGGLLSGNGAFRLNSNTLSGMIAPSMNYDEMSFLGSQVFENTATHSIGISGATPSIHDRISVGGTATIGGILETEFDPMYVPMAGDRIVFLTANNINGTYSSLSPALPSGWSVDYSVAGEVALMYTPPPLFGASVAERNELDASSSFSIYPNPIASGERLYFLEKNGNKALNISILNQEGRLVKSYNSFENGFINIPNLESGVYFIELESALGIEREQIIVLD